MSQYYRMPVIIVSAISAFFLLFAYLCLVSMLGVTIIVKLKYFVNMCNLHEMKFQSYGNLLMLSAFPIVINFLGKCI